MIEAVRRHSVAAPAGACYPATVTDAPADKKDRLALWLDFGKWDVGTLLVGLFTTAVNYIIKERELELAKLEQERAFLESFVQQAMDATSRSASGWRTT